MAAGVSPPSLLRPLPSSSPFMPPFRFSSSPSFGFSSSPPFRPLALSPDHRPLELLLDPPFAHCHATHTSNLCHGLDPRLLPRHVAVIMDGNSRWALAKGLPRSAGHEAGVKALRLAIQLSSQWGIQALTVFGFSTENWNRSAVEVSFIMELFLKVVREELPLLMREGIVARFIGNTKQLSIPLQKLIHEVEEKTSKNSGLKLTIALNYSGRRDILDACQKIVEKVKQGQLRIEDIVESEFDQHLGTTWLKEIQNPDLLIRTSGELRVSNFLLWQIAYAELYFMDECWPDLTEESYANAMLSYQKRKRRYGARPGSPNP